MLGIPGVRQRFVRNRAIGLQERSLAVVSRDRAPPFL